VKLGNAELVPDFRTSTRPTDRRVIAVEEDFYNSREAGRNSPPRRSTPATLVREPVSSVAADAMLASMKPRVYSYSKCSTCRKALNFLDSNEVEYDSVDIVTSPPKKKELKDVLARSGLPVKKLFNTSGLSYREGGFGQRLQGMSESDALDALAADGKLIKRPLVVGADYALVGFEEKAYRTRFK
jgi:arsenate reductase